jgi:hypothetical protein
LLAVLPGVACIGVKKNSSPSASAAAGVQLAPAAALRADGSAEKPMPPMVLVLPTTPATPAAATGVRTDVLFIAETLRPQPPWRPPLLPFGLPPVLGVAVEAAPTLDSLNRGGGDRLSLSLALLTWRAAVAGPAANAIQDTCCRLSAPGVTAVPAASATTPSGAAALYCWIANWASRSATSSMLPLVSMLLGDAAGAAAWLMRAAGLQSAGVLKSAAASAGCCFARPVRGSVLRLPPPVHVRPQAGD